MLIALSQSSVLAVIPVGDKSTFKRLDSFKVNSAAASDNILYSVRELEANTIRDKHVPDFTFTFWITNVQEDSLLAGVHDLEVVGQVEVLGHAHLLEVKESVLSS
jgi:hypothetical protein